MRVIKSEAELEKMRVAQVTTQHAIEAMMRYAHPGVNECALEGAFDFELAKQNVREHAFHSIVAGGARATTLHYGENNQVVNDGEMVLIDLGSAHRALLRGYLPHLPGQRQIHRAPEGNLQHRSGCAGPHHREGAPGHDAC